MENQYDYIATWCYLDGSKGQEGFDSASEAKQVLCRRITLMGGLGTVTRMSDFKDVYRIWNLEETEQAHAA